MYLIKDKIILRMHLCAKRRAVLWRFAIIIGLILLGRLTCASTGEIAKYNDYAYWICLYYENPKVNVQNISAIMFTESSYRTNAVSYKGAVGLMQIMPDCFLTAKWSNPNKMGEWSYDDVKTDWRKNVWVGIFYFNECLKASKNNLADAFRYYNHGINADKNGNKKCYAYTKKVIRAKKYLSDSKS